MSERYNRQQLIPEWDQDKLSKSKVLILGIGATGSYVATNLAQSGIGELLIVDYDTVELNNLNRQLLFQDQDIGENKAIIAKSRLLEINPNISISAFPKKMQQLSNAQLEGVDIIACCLDTFRGRRWANSLALRETIPMVNGGMYAFMGDIQTIIPYETACFECQPLVSQEKLAQACSPLGEKRQEDRENSDEREEAPIPSVATLSSIIGGFMSQELIKILLEIGTPVQNYLFYDGLVNTFTQLELERNKNCPMCGTGEQMDHQTALVFPGETVGDFKQRVALAFGMADPQLTRKGKILRDDNELTCNEGDKIYATDERLATPIAIKVKMASKEQ